MSGGGGPGHARCWAHLHLVVEIGVHLGVHLVDDVDGGREVDQEEADLLQALLLSHVLALGERFQEVGLIGCGVQSCLETVRGGAAALVGRASRPGTSRSGRGRPPVCAGRGSVLCTLGGIGQERQRAMCVPFHAQEGQEEGHQLWGQTEWVQIAACAAN